MRIAEWPLQDVRIVCQKCGLETSIPRDEIGAVFGWDTDMFSLRQDMTDSCIPTKNEVCQSRLADALLVQAIMEPDEDKVVDKSLIAVAKEFREKVRADA